MPFNQELPQWNAVGDKPPQSKLDSGWQIGERPPAGWWNWLLNRTHKAIEELQNEAINIDQKGVANGVATLGADGKVPASQLNVTAPADASTTVKGIVMLEDSVSSTSTTKAATPNSVRQVNTSLTNHVGDTAIHVSSADRTNWNSKANGTHTHAIADVTGLQTALDGKASTSHSHANATPSAAGFMSSTDKSKLDGIEAKIDGAKDELSAQIGILSDKVDDLKTVKSSKDTNGIFTTLTYRRKSDNSLFATSVLSGGASPNYTTRTVTYYEPDGLTVRETLTYTLTYDADGVLVSEV